MPPQQEKGYTHHMANKYSVRNFLTCIYGYTFFNATMLLAPVYAVFMQSRGVSDFGISVLLMLWSGGVLVTQFPVAHLARRFGAKNVLFSGQVLKAAAFILWMLWPTFSGFAIGMLLWGMHGAIYNVVSEDVLYDELRARTNTLAYERILGQRKNVAAIGTAVSSSGSLLWTWGYEWITALSIVSLVLSMLFISQMNLIQKYRGIADNGCSVIKSICGAVSVMRATPMIVTMLVLCVLVTNFSYLNDYLALIGYDIGVPASYIGAVPFFIMGCQVIGQAFAHKFVGMSPMIMYVMIMVAGAFFGLFALDYTIWGLVALGAGYVICAVIKILLYARFQNLIPSQNRMEVLSFYSIADQASYMVICLIIGLGSMLGSWRNSIAILAVLLVSLGGWAMIFARRRAARRATMPNPTPNTTVRPYGGEIA